MSSTHLIASKPKSKLTGGIHLQEHKSQSADTILQTCPLPKFLMLPLNMHSGADAIVSVSIGDRVHKGQMIAKAAVGISACIHSPADGVVIDIKPMAIASNKRLIMSKAEIGLS